MSFAAKALECSCLDTLDGLCKRAAICSRLEENLEEPRDPVNSLEKEIGLDWMFSLWPMLKPPVLRFAPSPTGYLHLGGLRTALYNHLFARKHRGKWILRIEDTDKTRFMYGAVDNIRRSLEWAGLEYDYGPGVGGPHEPYFQSERLDLYTEYAQKLVESGHAYHCFCSTSDLKLTRESMVKRRSNKTYDKKCLHLSEEEVSRRKRAGRKFVIRLNDESPPRRPIPTDLIFGSLKDAHESLPTDPILVKSDGYPTYHLASVVDDLEMGITHVLRGEEWLPSLPLHLDLYACLGLQAPEYGHLPLLLNADGSKMSKRNGDVSVQDYMAQGYMPSAVINWLALAGWGASHGGKSAQRGAPTSTEIFTLPELIEKFDISFLTPRRAILETSKLQVLNAKHLHRALSDPNLVGEIIKQARSLVAEEYDTKKDEQIIATLDFEQILDLTKDRMKNLNELPKLLDFLFRFTEPSSMEDLAKIDSLDSERYREVIKKYYNLFAEAISKGLPWNEQTIASVEAKRESPDELVLLRRALTGKKKGLPLVTTMLILGRDETLHRLRVALRAVEMLASAKPFRSSV